MSLSLSKTATYSGILAITVLPSQLCISNTEEFVRPASKYVDKVSLLKIPYDLTLSDPSGFFVHNSKTVLC